MTDSGDDLYNALNHLPEDGIYIVSREDDADAEQRIDWLNANPHYQRLHEFPSLVLYQYHAGNLTK